MAVLVLWIHAYCCCIVFFSQITQDQVTAFQAEAKKFNEKFKMEGPASVGTDLDKGKRGSSLTAEPKSIWNGVPITGLLFSMVCKVTFLTNPQKFCTSKITRHTICIPNHLELLSIHAFSIQWKVSMDV